MNRLAHVVRVLVDRFDKTVGYLRSFFDEPAAPKRKASMVRFCAPVALGGALYAVKRTFDFADANPKEVGMAGVLAGVVATLATGVVLHLLTRTKADSSVPIEGGTTTDAAGAP